MLELVLVIVIIAVLFVIAVDKLLILKVSAEQVAMKQVLGVLRSAMTLDIASHIVKNNIQGLATKEGTNPMDWLSEKPDNYIGILNEPDPTDVQGNSWYFDNYSRMLIYRVTNKEYFKSELSGPARARFKIKLDYTDINENGIFDYNIDEIHGLILTSIDAYQWTNEADSVTDYAK